MEPDICKQLTELNFQFYQSFAKPFSITRKRLQPGVSKIIKWLNPNDEILDLGCGNGELRRALLSKGHTGCYVGLDFSPELLKFARDGVPQTQSVFLQADLTSPTWDIRIPVPSFDIVLAFAIIHHIPGHSLRLQVLQKIHKLLVPGGYFYHSQWQFHNSPRLKKRVISWETIGISNKQVEDGDYLIDWRYEGRGLRYIHLFDESELSSLARECGFTISDTFYSDGEGGNLGLYQCWEKTIP